MFTPFTPRTGARAVVVAIVVEDDAAIRAPLVEALEDAGFRAVGADGLAEARRLLASTPRPILLVDLELADGSGEELLIELARAGRRVPAALVTAARHGRAVAERNGVRHLGKPFDLDHLVRVIEALALEAAREPESGEAAG